jgi:hypothetical protein
MHWQAGYPGHMTEPARLDAPPQPTPEQLTEWRAIASRVADGDETGLVPWDEIATELGL